MVLVVRVAVDNALGGKEQGAFLARFGLLLVPVAILAADFNVDALRVVDSDVVGVVVAAKRIVVVKAQGTVGEVTQMNRTALSADGTGRSQISCSGIVR